VAKSTVYRHWGGKSALVADAFAYAGPEKGKVPPPGPVRERVVAILQELAAALGAELGPRLECLMPALIDAAERSEETAQLTCQLADKKRKPLLTVLDDGVAAGELPPGTDTGVLADALEGPILLRRLFHRPPVTPAEIPALVDMILPRAAPEPPGAP
jgi:AcrR family transcriptional regulator